MQYTRRIKSKLINFQFFIVSDLPSLGTIQDGSASARPMRSEHALAQSSMADRPRAAKAGRWEDWAKWALIG